VVSLLKRWLLGTHQGAIGPEHLDYCSASDGNGHFGVSG